MNMAKLGRELGQVDKKFYHVNYGGCGCIAAMIAKAFRSSFPIMRITSTGCYGNTDLDEIRHHLDDNMSKDAWYHSGIHFAHVWVEVLVKDRWYVLDATGVHTRKVMYAIWSKPADGSFSIDEIQSLADDPSWNSAFDRNQLPGIGKMIHHIAKEY